MNLLTILIFWAIGCIALVILNAKFWKIMPDLESREHNQNKAENKPSINPTVKDTLHAVRLFLFIGIVCGIVYGICTLIKNII